jgi:predicted PurR-regulated permease PerM
LLLIIVPILLFTPAFVKQSISVYNFTKNLDYGATLRTVLPSLFSSGQLSIEIDGAVHSFIPKIADYLRNYFEGILFNLPVLFFELIIVLFVFYFSLRDEGHLLNYIKEILPFSSDIKERIFKYSKDITASVLYGTVILGIVQGIFVGIGFFIFGAPSALILTILAIIASILPAIPTAIVWAPVAIYLLVQGNLTGGIGILIFGFLSIIIENLLRPLFISRRVKFHSSIILIGMVGGLFPFGMFGIILGPLILSYIYIVFEVLKEKKLI